MSAVAQTLVSAATGRDDLTTLLHAPENGIDLPSPLSLAELTTASVGGASLGADALAYARRRGQRAETDNLTPIAVDGARLTAAYRSEQVFTLDGLRPHAWAPASGFFEAASGWARTHANHPHHAAALEPLLRLPTGAGREEVANALRRHTASDWEERAAGVGADLVPKPGAIDATATHQRKENYGRLRGHQL